MLHQDDGSLPMAGNDGVPPSLFAPSRVSRILARRAALVDMLYTDPAPASVIFAEETAL